MWNRDECRALDAVSRRGFLNISAGAALSALAGAAPRQVAAGAKIQPTADSMILLWMAGGPSHIDMFDRKPNAPEEYRGPLKGIPTSLPGLETCEHLPETAKRMLDRMLKSLGGETLSFDVLQKADPQQLAKFIHNELSVCSNRRFYR